jgi:methyl-accepting chemotaxis protein
MKSKVRNKMFTTGIVLFMVIISTLSITSVYYLNRLSKKTELIQKENYRSVAYSRDMAAVLTRMNQKIILNNINPILPDTTFFKRDIVEFQRLLLEEKNNITEIGEDKLVAAIEADFKSYFTEFKNMTYGSDTKDILISFQEKYENLYQKLLLLSQMNEEAIERKTEDAKISTKQASLRMSGIAGLCFLIAYAFTFSFSSYFNDRFKDLHKGIIEIAGTNYNHRLSFTGEDEFSEMAVIINDMAEKINRAREEAKFKNHTDPNVLSKDVEELKKVLLQLKDTEKQAVILISKFENIS